MARPIRHDIVEPGATHHVILRGNNRRNLFSRSDTYCEFLRYFGDSSTRYGVPIHALALMRNHVHLVVTPPEVEALAAFVKLAAQRYAASRNKRRSASGKLFEQRYGSFRIRDLAQLATTIAYVDLNPVRARMVGGPADYTWSSYRAHAGSADAHRIVSAIWTPHDWYVGLSASPRRRAVVYAEWVADRRATAAEQLEAIAVETDDDDDLPRGRDERPDGSRVEERAEVPYGELPTRLQKRK